MTSIRGNKKVIAALFCSCYSNDQILFKDTLKAFEDFKKQIKKHMKYCFLICKSIYMFWKFIQCPIHWDKVQTLQKISYDKINVTKMYPFFFREFWLITVLFLIHNSCMNWSTRVVSLKPCVGVSNFNSAFFY